MDILDRASSEFGGRKLPATIEGELSRRAAARIRASDLDLSAPKWPRQRPRTAPRIPARAGRLTLSGWQTAGAVIAVVGIVVGAFGMATYGYVAARDWGCKTGAFQSGCPA